MDIVSYSLFKKIQDQILANEIFLSVKSYGASGDGQTDDTEAILKALQEAREKEKNLFFPSGTYMIKKGLYLPSNIKVTGEKGAVIKKFAAITQEIQQPVSEGDTEVYVEDASVYEVGQDVHIMKSTNDARRGTHGEVTSIDTENNKITFNSYWLSGATDDYEEGSKFSSTFSILRTNAVKEVSENIVIEGITLDANAQPDEPDVWDLSPIHSDPDIRSPHLNRQRRMRIVDVKILNSPADAVSHQGGGEIYVENCLIDGCKRQGIHLGTIFSDAVIQGNRIMNCGIDGVFLCEKVSNVRVVHNFLKNCDRGIGSESQAGPGSKSIIANNNFEDIATYGVEAINWDGIAITGNQFHGMDGFAIYAPGAKAGTITGNVMRDFKQSGLVAINVANGEHINITGNTILIPDGTSINDNGLTGSNTDGNIIVESS